MPTSATGNLRGTSGFTLFELLVVIFVLGLFASIVALRIEGVVSGGDLRLASRMITGEITRLRSRAAYTHREHTLVFNVSEETLLASDAPVEEEKETFGEWSLQKSPAPKGRRLPEGIDLQDVVIFSSGKKQEGEGVMRFFPNGTVDRALIHIRNEREESYTIEVQPLTGNAVLHEGYIDQKMDE
jgi:prepilin-type N-terminal cleavage/methylation domain-containing protein